MKKRRLPEINSSENKMNKSYNDFELGRLWRFSISGAPMNAMSLSRPWLRLPKTNNFSSANRRIKDRKNSRQKAENKMNRAILFSIISLIFILAIISSVSALGVTPARTTVDFTPGLKKTVSFSIVNSEKKNLEIAIAKQGELKDYVSLSTQSVSLSSSDDSRQVSYDVNLPQSLSPGLHTAEVIVLELPSQSGSSEAYVGAALAVVTQLYVYVPYPGKYADAELNIVNADNNKEVTFVIPVLSQGEFDLTDVSANIDIYNSASQKVASFNTDSISVKSGERKEIVSKWKADVPVGTYTAKVTLIYDGETKSFEKTFNVGSQDLELQSLQVKNFNLGDIAKIEMLVENKWSEQITGAYAETQIFNDKNEMIADFKSQSYDIPALTKKVLLSYWDTAGVREGKYKTKISLNYGDKSLPRDIELKVSQNNIEAIGLGYVISSSSSSGGNSNLAVILVVGIVVLVLINVVWFIVLRKKLTGK